MRKAYLKYMYTQSEWYYSITLKAEYIWSLRWITGRNTRPQNAEFSENISIRLRPSPLAVYCIGYVLPCPYHLIDYLNSLLVVSTVAVSILVWPSKSWNKVYIRINIWILPRNVNLFNWRMNCGLNIRNFIWNFNSYLIMVTNVVLVSFSSFLYSFQNFAYLLCLEV